MTLNDRNAESFARRPVGWCPSCNKSQPCTQLRGSDMAQQSSYSCDECGGITHDPLIRLAVPFQELGINPEGL